MKKLLSALGAFIFIGAAIVLSTGATIPLFTGPNCAEASQLLPCLNSLIQTLNGVTSTGSSATATIGIGSNGGTINTGGTNGVNNTNPAGPGTSAGVGSAFTPVVANFQRAVVQFLTPVGAQSQTSTLTVNDTLINTGSTCLANIQGMNWASTTIPFISGLTPTTQGGVNALQLIIGNLGVAQVTSQINVAFWCQ